MKGKGEMLNSSRQKTLEEIFEDPVRSDVQWNKIESLIVALGGDVKEGGGSRVRFFPNGVVATFHHPLPQNQTDKGTLKSVRNLLRSAEVRVEDRS
jgi:hypothetical protein